MLNPPNKLLLNKIDYVDSEEKKLISYLSSIPQELRQLIFWFAHPTISHDMYKDIMKFYWHSKRIDKLYDYYKYGKKYDYFKWCRDLKKFSSKGIIKLYDYYKYGHPDPIKRLINYYEYE